MRRQSIIADLTLDEGDLDGPDRQGPGIVHHHVDLEPVGDEGIDVGGDVVAGRLGQLRSEVADVDLGGLGGRQRLADSGHGHDGEHAGEQRARSEDDLVGGANGVDRAGRRFGVRRHDRDSADAAALPSATCPSTSPRAPMPLSTTGPAVAGSTRPTAPRSRPASSSASRKSPVEAGQAGDHEVAEGVAIELAGVEAVLEGLAQTESAAASAPRQRRRSPGAGMPRASRRRPLEPPSSATETMAVIVRRVGAHGAQAGGQAVAAADGDHLHLVMSRWCTLGANPRAAIA